MFGANSRTQFSSYHTAAEWQWYRRREECSPAHILDAMGTSMTHGRSSEPDRGRGLSRERQPDTDSRLELTLNQPIAVAP